MKRWERLVIVIAYGISTLILLCILLFFASCAYDSVQVAKAVSAAKAQLDRQGPPPATAHRRR